MMLCCLHLCALEREPYRQSEKLRISITGAGGFIASHIASDWKKNEHMTEDMFCHEFHLVDLRVMENCLKNHSVIMYNNTMISFNMLEAARISGVKSLKMFMAWKSLQLRSFSSTTPKTLESSAVLEGGREKAPAAFCRKAITSIDKFEMWGDGLQTRSFTFIDECVEGVLGVSNRGRGRIFGYFGFIVIATVAGAIAAVADAIAAIAAYEYFSRPSTPANVVVVFPVGWAEDYILLDQGTIEKEKAQGIDLLIYGSSKVVGTQAPVQLGSLRAADGKE
ncbi:hypothetical protein F3Y22_tig00113123pilonHSYRG00141 [Hibiscus syriacus]|uniref:NAD-dependent epimerase/dehydratase domain-containing protein n=1 Tax=Hibiscus syriacus TaxID=106335 RepID=A0A6A2X7C1_HIBSY|nr:hypothetical protein F3Y22_tig00113123pilonHSYRG00141 [Hibiscus syriacus]